MTGNLRQESIYCHQFQDARFLNIREKVHIAHRTTESNTLKGYIISAIDSERGYKELSTLYMERLFNIYSNI